MEADYTEAYAKKPKLSRTNGHHDLSELMGQECQDEPCDVYENYDLDEDDPYEYDVRLLALIKRVVKEELNSRLDGDRDYGPSYSAWKSRYWRDN